MPEQHDGERTERQRCIFVIGPEGSGSTYIARLLSRALNGGEWSGRGFNCCDEGQCDRENGFTSPCRSPEHLVCHRSLPFRGNWAPIEKWQSMYDCRFVLCTRDGTVARFSAERRFGKKREVAREHNQRAGRMLAGLLAGESTCFVWSYETFALLGIAYLDRLFSFLEIDTPVADEVLTPFRDENRKYISRPFELLWRRPLRWLRRSIQPGRRR